MEPTKYEISLVNTNPTSQAQHEDDLRVISQKAAKHDLILYFGREEFSDNSKYQFLHASAQPGGFRHVWCCFNKPLIQELRTAGLEAFDLGENANRTLQLLLRAKIAVFTLNPAESLKSRMFLAAVAGAQKVQLWHGIGVKRMQIQNIEVKNLLDPATVAAMRWSTEIDCIVSPSEPFDRHWEETFGVKRVIRAGYPRNEVLLRAATGAELINVPVAAIKESSRRKVLIAPTWGGVERHWTKFLKPICAAAHRHDLEIYLKPHPYEAPFLKDFKAPEGGRVTVLPASGDLYPLMNRFSCMITDHSSMAFDAFLLDMPLIFQQPNTPALYMTDMLEPAVGPTIETFDDLVNLPALLEQAVQSRENRTLARDKFFETPPLEASQTIHATIQHLARAA